MSFESVSLVNMSPQKVMIAIDASENASKALQYYLQHLHQEGNHVTLIHSIDIPYMQSVRHNENIPQLFKQAKTEAKQLEDKYVEMLKDKGIEAEVLAELSSHPGQFIVDAAGRAGAGMVVLGSRGLGTVRRTILGSVSDYVVHHAHCAVVVCKQ